MSDTEKVVPERDSGYCEHCGQEIYLAHDGWLKKDTWFHQRGDRVNCPPTYAAPRADLCAPVDAEGEGADKCTLCGHIKLSPWRGYCKHEVDVHLNRRERTKYCGCTCVFPNVEVQPRSANAAVNALVAKLNSDCANLDAEVTRLQGERDQVVEMLSAADRLHEVTVDARIKADQDNLELRAELAQLVDPNNDGVDWHAEFCKTQAKNERLQAEVERRDEPANCGVAGHFKFQENGGHCLMCQRETRLTTTTRAEAIRECADKVRNAYDLTYGDGDGLRIIDTRGLDALAALLEGESR